jgi:hypothetical protein
MVTQLLGLKKILTSWGFDYQQFQQMSIYLFFFSFLFLTKSLVNYFVLKIGYRYGINEKWQLGNNMI